jgi:ferritin-like metal-binding protein YciE
METPMSHAQDLKSLYIEELQDLWSANDQMQRMVEDMAERAEDERIADGFKQSASGIGKHTAALRTLIGRAGGKEKPESCKGMEGLVKEATKHLKTDAPERGELRDIVMLAQYQRMSHYGIAGFGTAAAYAKALGRDEEHRELRKMVAEIYKADQYATRFAEQAETEAAKSDGTKS